MKTFVTFTAAACLLYLEHFYTNPSGSLNSIFQKGNVNAPGMSDTFFMPQYEMANILIIKNEFYGTGMAFDNKMKQRSDCTLKEITIK